MPPIMYSCGHFSPAPASIRPLDQRQRLSYWSPPSPCGSPIMWNCAIASSVAFTRGKAIGSAL